MNSAPELTYTRVGDYYLPNLLPPPEPQIGIWGQRRRDYLQKERNPIYIGMLLSGTLNEHLESIDQQAIAMFSQTVTSLAQAEGVTEQLKARDQMAWVGLMNSIRHRAEEIVRKALICVREKNEPNCSSPPRSTSFCFAASSTGATSCWLRVCAQIPLTSC